MATFCDNKQDKWIFDFTIGDIKRVKATLGADLLQLLPTAKPLSNEFREWIKSGGFDPDTVTEKQELFLRNIYSQEDESEQSLLYRLNIDALFLFEVIYVLLQPQLDAKSIKDEEFGHRLGGEEITDASEAFWGALADFFLKRGQTGMQKVILAQSKMTLRAQEVANRSAEETLSDEKVEELIAQDLDEFMTPGN